MDYDELLKNFEDDSAKKRPSSQNTVPNVGSHSARTQKPEDELDRIIRERQKRVENFKVNVGGSQEKGPAYNGVYLSNTPRDIADTAEKRSAPRRSAENQCAEPKSKLKVTVPPATEKQKKAIEARNKKNGGGKAEKRKETFSHIAIIVAIIALSSVLLCIYGIRCINDVLAIKTEDKAVEVTISSPNMSDGEVINLLKKNDLINNKLFCKLFIKFLDKGGEYVTGVYTLTPDMGIEKMLSTMKADFTLSETVTLTFPEGFTIDQIAQKLETNKVCNAASFIITLQTVDFSSEYSFITHISNPEARFRKLEGYLYPDTYEFYIGETASSVARKFLDNFKNRWTEEYADIAKERGLTVDDVITMASILQKEAATSAQMPVISSILYNRLAKSATFPWLQCDSTETYLTETIKPTLTSSMEDTEKYLAFRNNYDTYSKECVGLPVGPIGNPGDAAINAALNPDETDYYYFRHDNKGGVYYASTFAEHEQNGITVEEVNAEE